MGSRWYELSPEVSMVISKLELLKEIDRTRYAKIMLNELRIAGYKPNEQIYLNRIQNYNMTRWYDKNRFLFMAIEYLKDCESDMQSTISQKILKLLREENLNG